MAKLLNKSQRIELGVQNPTSVYSRVVSCSESTTHGNPRAFYTVVVGQVVRLLEIKLFWQPRAVDHLSQTRFRVMTGMTIPLSAGNMDATWEDILPKLGAGAVDAVWIHHYGITEMCWKMNKLFTGSGRRFGVWINMVMPDTAQYCQASFEISEG